MDGQCYKSNVIAGFGNPLIDISATVLNTDIFQKFNLQPDGQKEVESEEIDTILNILKRNNYKTTYNPGGCCQNTLRIIQALIKQPSYCVFFGGLGDDKDGELLEAELKKCGVNTRYTRQTGHPTGKVVALINGENRSLVAHLGAAEIYSKEDFATEENLKIFQDTHIIYVEGFFITHSFEVSLEALTLSRTLGSVVAFNISGAYVADVSPKELIHMANCADVILGNIAEFKALAKIIGVEDNIPVEDLALKIHLSLEKHRSSETLKYGKTIVITQGKGAVICVSEGESMIKHEVPNLDYKLVKDPTGAGDAFSAGFLVGLIQGRSLNECLAYGCETAQQVIQNIGVQL